MKMKNWLKRNKPIWIGGLIGFLSQFIIPWNFIIWGIGKAFFEYPTSSYIMRWGCYDSCDPYIAEIRFIIISIVSILIGVLIVLIIQKVRKN